MTSRKAKPNIVEFSVVNRLVNGFANIVQAVILGALIWVLSSVSSVRENVAVLQVQVATINSSTTALSAQVLKATEDRYRRQDAENDLAKRDARLDAIEQMVQHNRDLINNTNRK